MMTTQQITYYFCFILWSLTTINDTVPSGLFRTPRRLLSWTKCSRVDPEERRVFPSPCSHISTHLIPSSSIPYHILPVYTSTVNVAVSAPADFGALPPFRSSARLEAIFASNILLDRALLGSSLASFSIVPVPGHDRGKLVNDLGCLSKTTQLVQMRIRKQMLRSIN